MFSKSMIKYSEAVVERYSIKKGVLRNFAKFTGKHLCQSLKKETLAQVFSCEFCEISTTTFSYRTPPVTPSEYLRRREAEIEIGGPEILTTPEIFPRLAPRSVQLSTKG